MYEFSRVDAVALPITSRLRDLALIPPIFLLGHLESDFVKSMSQR